MCIRDRVRGLEERPPTHRRADDERCAAPSHSGWQMTSRLRVLFLVLVVACSAAFGCGGPPAPRAPEGNGRALATLVAAAFKSEALEPPEAALQRWLLVVAEAKTGDSAWHVAALRAAVDSLTLRPVTALRDVTERSALAYRTSKIGGVDAEQVVE